MTNELSMERIYVRENNKNAWKIEKNNIAILKLI